MSVNSAYVLNSLTDVCVPPPQYAQRSSSEFFNQCDSCHCVTVSCIHLTRQDAWSSLIPGTGARVYPARSNPVLPAQWHSRKKNIFLKSSLIIRMRVFHVCKAECVLWHLLAMTFIFLSCCRFAVLHIWSLCFWPGSRESCGFFSSFVNTPTTLWSVFGFVIYHS